MIQKIRNVTQKKRGWLVAVVAIIIIGTLSSYIVWSSGNYSSSKDTATDYKQLIANYQSVIKDTEKELAAKPNDYSLLQELGDLNGKLADAYTSDNQKDKASAAFVAAAKYYEQSLSYLPEGMNNKGKTDIYADIALTYWLSSTDDAKAETNFKKGISLTPEDFTINNNYVVFLYDTKGIDAAITQAKAYRQTLPTGNTNIANADQLIKNLESAKASQSQSSSSGTSSSTTK